MSDNTKAIELLDEWFNESDEMGAEFWDEYEKELAPLDRGVAEYQRPVVRALTGKQ